MPSKEKMANELCRKPTPEMKKENIAEEAWERYCVICHLYETEACKVRRVVAT
jgi:hypothetical protein